MSLLFGVYDWWKNSSIHSRPPTWTTDSHQHHVFTSQEKTERAKRRPRTQAPAIDTAKPCVFNISVCTRTETDDVYIPGRQVEYFVQKKPLLHRVLSHRVLGKNDRLSRWEFPSNFGHWSRKLSRLFASEQWHTAS
ncbi:hypothetical protein HYALB_00011306 [Hymenoscyphus albidus]|uniref:Uncharacterized protein n=1 Tax=Hymenoscyphus albidus TaxID=595503 RepID=A0A9N9LC89_9HELO|nr:hypothetical protein HYALB_00011306 [Hymenoscyphus albidus]